MNYLLDTDTCIAWLNRRRPALLQCIEQTNLMIAAIAQCRGLILVTHNIAEFTRVPDLTVEDWLADG